jgi:hypothetical protein
LGVGSWELGVGSCELGVGSWEFFAELEVVKLGVDLAAFFSGLLDRQACTFVEQLFQT